MHEIAAGTAVPGPCTLARALVSAGSVAGPQAGKQPCRVRWARVDDPLCVVEPAADHHLPEDLHFRFLDRFFGALPLLVRRVRLSTACQFPDKISLRLGVVLVIGGGLAPVTVA